MKLKFQKQLLLKHVDQFLKILRKTSNDDSFLSKVVSFTAQKMKFFIKDFFGKCDQIRSFLSAVYFLCGFSRHTALLAMYSDRSIFPVILAKFADELFFTSANA